MKSRPAFCLCFLFYSLAATAQVKVPLTNNELRNGLEKVLTDFPQEFIHLKGEVIAENPQSTEYQSQLKFSVARENTIIKYSGAKAIYSWQASFISTEDFAEAQSKYKWLCNQLKVMTVNLGNGYSFTLDGNYQVPDESNKFISSIYTLTPAASNLPKMKIEATMEYSFPEWKVGLWVYQREREDKDRGPQKDGK